MHVVVVESPAKAKTINSYLGNDYQVLASFGHVRDLLSKNGSVMPEQDFKMLWHTQPDGAKRLKSIADALKSADSLILATDPDREGEAISWHLLEALDKRKALKGISVQRVAFNAITKNAVRNAMQSPRNLDQHLVDAYLARRALDYLVGFTLSPVLWRKLPGSRSAGRVQSVALRLIVDRQIEIDAFKPQEYWTVETDIRHPITPFKTRLFALDGNTLRKFDLACENDANIAASRVRQARFSVASVDAKLLRSTPPPPFTTSTLQQEAARKLGFDAQLTMATAQKLYEQGHITYMRTDGVQMADQAYLAARKNIAQRFGNPYLPKQPRRYTAKSKNAQEAHEAIRPTNFDTSPEIQRLQNSQKKLYTLIHSRTVASQMQQAVLERTTVNINDVTDSITLRATGQVTTFDGYQKLYREGRDDSKDDSANSLPTLNTGDALNTGKTEPIQHSTEPPPRYSESSLVKKMEEIGIGRPSTYAATLSTLRDREYVRMEKKRFIPENKGQIVTLFLARFFTRYVAYDFTADLEQQLDLVSDGKLNWKKLLGDFWTDFKNTADSVSLTDRSDIVDALDNLLETHLFHTQDNQTIDRSCPKCTNGRLGLKLGKLGAFVGCSTYPQCHYTRPLDNSSNKDHHPSADEERFLGTHPQNGQHILQKNGPYGPYVQINSDNRKPKRASIPKEWNPDCITLERALDLLDLPRNIGNHPEDNQNVIAGIGRYGPYVAHNKVFASLDSVDDVFEIGLNRAVSLIADKRNSKGVKRASTEPLKSLGTPPDGGDDILILNGRYGPYVKQGSVNASLPPDLPPQNVSMDLALELIAQRKMKMTAKKTRKSS